MKTGYDGFALYFYGPAENCVAMLREVKAGGRLRGSINVDRFLNLDEARVHVAPDPGETPFDEDPPARSFEEDQALMVEAVELARRHGLA